MEPHLAAVVLAGGGSRRMGAPKPEQDWHGTPLLHRSASLLLRVAAPVVVVARAGQSLPDLPPDVERAADARPDGGPLEGLAAGMRTVAGRAEAVFAASTDLPLLHPQFVRSVAAGLAGYQAAVPVLGGQEHPLAAAYRVELLPLVEALLAAGERRMSSLLDRASVRRLGLDELAHPESVRNVNTPAELAAARALPLPRVAVELHDAVAGTPGWHRAHVAAANLGALLRAVRWDDRPATELDVRLDGAAAPSDPALPLAEGDRVRLSIRPGVRSARRSSQRGP